MKKRDPSMRKVIFACIHSAGRSQMSAGFFNKYAEPAKAHAVSAGTQPADLVHSEVVEAMKEVGIDLSTVKPQKLTPELAQDVYLLVTMGCGDECPFVPVCAGMTGRCPIPRARR
jgi:arsenate reductase (thioredoxin)